MSENVELIDGWPGGNKILTPYSTDCLLVSIMTSGSIECEVNLRPMRAEGANLMVIIPGRVIDKVKLSDDFGNKLFSFSPSLLKKMELEHSLRTKLLISRQVFYPLGKEELESFLTYYSLLGKILEGTDNPYIDMAVLSLTRAYFYSIGYYLHGPDKSNLSPHEDIADRFLTLAEREFKTHRDVGYYAGQLCMTPKYLATVVKETTGATPMMWLSRYTVLYAKSRLSGTTLSVQEISDSLSFPDQSTFGRYFKRIAGMSPKHFRESISRREDAGE